MLRFLIFLTLILTTHIAAQDALIVGIAGGTGSGKTTFAKKIKEIFGDDVALIDQDSYYRDWSHLSMEERDQINFDHPDSLDFALLATHLIALKQQRPIFKPKYDFKTHTRVSGEAEVLPAKIILVEGILLFAVQEICDLCDIKIYVDVEADVRLLRRLERDLYERGRSFDAVQNQYLTTVKPMHNLFVEPSKVYADVIIPAVGDTTEAEKIIVSRLRGCL